NPLRPVLECWFSTDSSVSAAHSLTRCWRYGHSPTADQICLIFISPGALCDLHGHFANTRDVGGNSLMRTIFFILTITLGLIGCSNQTEPTPINDNLDPTDSTVTIQTVTSTSSPNSDTFNLIDSNGLRQGIWIYQLNGKLLKSESYVDSKLNGTSYEYLANGEIRKTDYSNGLQNGYFLQYWPDSVFGSFVSYWENGMHLWAAFPWELTYYLVPIKGFIINKDSAEIKVPYNSGKLMYTGTIIRDRKNIGKAIGIHKAYYETGKLKAIVDYDKNMIEIFDTLGQVTTTSTIRDWKGHRIQ
ncbi:MAG: hypothetical protein KDB85_13390, partial [Chitinophagales bacterium]|nr:hypothetical protein [Chitinophagales bacterium]